MSDEPNTPPPPDDGAPDAAAADVEALKRERDDLYDRLLRKTAEFDNYRKRIDRERREQVDRAVVSLLEQLLAVVDDFDLAMAAPDSDTSSYRKGVAMINTKLHDMLRKQGLKPIDALGADFDPNLHEAVMQEPAAEGQRDNQVIGVMRQGYTLNDRLLRAAVVKVAKA